MSNTQKWVIIAVVIGLIFIFTSNMRNGAPSQINRPASSQALELTAEEQNQACDIEIARFESNSSPSRSDWGLVIASCPEERHAEISSLFESELLQISRAEEAAAEERERAAARRQSSWTISTDTSEMLDTTDVYIGTTGSPYLNRFGRPHSPTLLIRCMENTTSIIWSFDEYLGLDSANLMVRLDDAPPQTFNLGISTDRDAVGMWRGRQAIPFIRRLENADRMVVRITPYGESPRESIFDVKDLDLFTPELKDACNWN